MNVVISSQVILSRAPEGPLAAHIAAFAESLNALGYASKSVHRQVLIVVCSSRWLGQVGVTLPSVNADHSERYLGYRARHLRSCPGDFAALGHFIDFPRHEGLIPPEKIAARQLTAIDRCAESYELPLAPATRSVSMSCGWPLPAPASVGRASMTLVLTRQASMRRASMQYPRNRTRSAPCNQASRIDCSSKAPSICSSDALGWYLSWPYAVAQLRMADPSATWEVRRFGGLPYLATELGVFVEVAVSVQDVTLSQIHPVLDGRNRPLLAPTSFDINTSIQRALVKAIALHGLGLHIYAGEDLPVANAEVSSANDEPIKPTEVPAPTSTVRTLAPTICGPQQARLQKLIVETGTELQRLLDHFGIDRLAELPAAEFIRVERTLETRRAA